MTESKEKPKGNSLLRALEKEKETNSRIKRRLKEYVERKEKKQDNKEEAK